MPRGRTGGFPFLSSLARPPKPPNPSRKRSAAKQNQPRRRLRMAAAGALHAGGRHLLPLRRSPGAPWSHVRSHPISSKPPSGPPPPPPPPPVPPSAAAASRFATPFVAPAGRRGGAVGAGVVRWYLGSIEARPVLTKSVTAAAIFTVADLSSQMITLGSEDSLDLVRTLRMASYGLLISGPSLHLWFNFVSKVFPKKDVVSTLKKMFLGQAVYGPIINSVFFSYNAGLQVGHVVDEEEVALASRGSRCHGTTKVAVHELELLLGTKARLTREWGSPLLGQHAGVTKLLHMLDTWHAPHHLLDAELL
ncbi:hypothetical protein GUJ93_ZPchr0009g1032 [Zizania palustris]|uniref:Uncharacterized protein n=1 Tax=Zizania palustris TaxID=103762 RepID=A0A8J5RMI3_ZIZPA|nr:hypothetical protein GUJ93_ZPchr0009g1032 [Zizania palustris]